MSHAESFIIKIGRLFLKINIDTNINLLPFRKEFRNILYKHKSGKQIRAEINIRNTKP